ncbi:MAG: YraN family protein [Lachnospiraceae bacterium]|nr:YraN family protein [Lachnospiraceae bacterium]
MNCREVGGDYERYAAQYLEKQGYRILERNFRCREGEIDLIAEENGYLCFIEVKYRSTTASGYPQEAVGYRKQRRIYRTAAAYLQKRKPGRHLPCRFDVVGISPEGIWLIRNAFGGM